MFSGILILAGCSTLEFKIVFQQTDGLMQGDAVFFEKNRLGTVKKISYRQEGDYLVLVDIKKEFSAAVTKESRFHIDRSPLESDAKAIILTLLQKGGVPLKSGTVIQGSELSSFPHVKPFFEKLEAGLNKFIGDLQKIPETREYKNLEKQLDKFVKEMQDKGTMAKDKFKDEILPGIKKEIELLRKKLEKFGREEELKPLEKKLNNLTEI